MNIKFFDIDKYYPVISVSKVKTYILYYIKSCKYITNINFNKKISTQYNYQVEFYLRNFIYNIIIKINKNIINI